VEDPLKLIERWGSGIKRMVEACIASGLEKPLLEEIGLHFRVTFFTKKVKHSKRIYQLDDIDKAILHSLKNGKGLSTQQIANAIDRSTRSTRSRLIILVEHGLVAEIGSGPKDPKRKYYLVKEN